MNVIKKGILNGKIKDTNFGFLSTDLTIDRDFETVNVGINCAGGVNIGSYRQVYNILNAHHVKRTSYYIKLTKANVRIVEGWIYLNANYVLCED